MTSIDLLVLLGGVAAIGGLTWFFFGRKRATSAQLHDGVQEITVTVKGGYSPDVIRVRQGIPVRLTFDRRESGDCTSRVVFPDLALSHSLPAKGSTTVEITPMEAGELSFACGMNMIHGRLMVAPAGHDGAALSGELPAPSPGVADTVVYAVTSQMTCASCVATIERAVSTLAGIREVSANLAAERVTVVSTPLSSTGPESPKRSRPPATTCGNAASPTRSTTRTTRPQPARPRSATCPAACCSAPC